MVTREDAEALIALPKLADPPQEWADRRNNGNQRELTFGLTDPNGRALAGVVAEVRVNAGRRVDSKRWAFGLFRRDGFTAARRIYMLEIIPPHVCGHRDEVVGAVKGCHERLGPHTAQLDAGMYYWPFTECLAWFAHRVNVTFESPVSDPFQLVLTR